MSTTTVESPKTELNSERAQRPVPFTRRRRFPRITSSRPMPVLIGRLEALAVDLSDRGVRFLYSGAFPTVTGLALLVMLVWLLA